MSCNDPGTKLVRTLRKGQITIPDEFRRRLGIEENTLLQVTIERDELRLKPVAVHERTQGSPWLRELYADFAPIRQEAAERGYTEEEINGWIDEALAAVRREQPDPRTA